MNAITNKVEGSNECFIRLATLIFPFPLPKAKKSVIYSRAFANPNTPKETTLVMEQADHLRDQVLDELLQNRPNNPAVTNTTERYIPVLHRIIASIDSSVSGLFMEQLIGGI